MYIILYHIISHLIIRSHIIWFIPCRFIVYRTLLYYTLPAYTRLDFNLYWATPYYTVLHYMFCTTLCYPMIYGIYIYMYIDLMCLYCVVLYCISLYYIICRVFYCIVLCYIILWSISFYIIMLQCTQLYHDMFCCVTVRVALQYVLFVAYNMIYHFESSHATIFR